MHYSKEGFLTPLSRVPIFIFYSYVFHIACMPFKESVPGVMALQEVISVFLLFCTGIRGRTILTIVEGTIARARAWNCSKQYILWSTPFSVYITYICAFPHRDMLR